MDRRQFLAASGSGALLAALGGFGPARAAVNLAHGKGTPFSWAGLIEYARKLAGQPYVAPHGPPDAILHKIDYAALGHVHYRTKDALYAHGPGRFPVTFFPMGRYFKTPVRMYALESAGGQTHAREIVYSAADFTMPADSPMHQLPADAGFAGFRVQESRLGDQTKKPWQHNDWAAFQGASYFRAIGALYQYGLSARGIAINTAVAGVREEFPDFTRFYFAPSGNDDDTLTVYALLEGPSVTGAYRFVLTRTKAVLMDIDAHVFLRADVTRLGLAPLTSMYWFSETRKPTGVDWRPEVHDSDGLALWTGAGEHIWRPLANPAKVRVSSFLDDNPHGFALAQRDRKFDHYLDGVHYELRPTAWVEPHGGWDKGSVQLVELPTGDEYNDNIVAMWVPHAPARAGQHHHLSYRLSWVAKPPFTMPLATCGATRFGHDSNVSDRPPQFVVEFAGGPLTQLSKDAKVEAMVSATHGQLARVHAQPVPGGEPGRWRALFDITASQPSDLRLYLHTGNQALTETWLYTFYPS